MLVTSTESRDLKLADSNLKKANKSLRMGLYDYALSEYKIFQERNEEIAWICEANIKLAKQKLSKSSHLTEDLELLRFSDFGKSNQRYHITSEKKTLHLELKGEASIAETLDYKVYTIAPKTYSPPTTHNNKKNISLICDKNFVEPTIVAISSCIRNGGPIDCIYLLAVDCADEIIEKIKPIYYGSVELKIIELNNIFSSIPSFKGLVTNAALFKFLLPYILNLCDSVLYIDGDVLVTGSLAELFARNFNDCFAFVVEDLVGVLIHKEHERLGSAKYFNSGVMYLNLAKMRVNAIPEKMINLKISGHNIKYMDQDVFNICLGANVEYISPYYNFMTTNNRLPEDKFLEVFPNHQDDHIKLIHYTYKKPWQEGGIDKAKYWYEDFRLTYGTQNPQHIYSSSAKTDIWAENYLNSFPRENSVLLIEAADCHGEIMPGLVLHMREIGFNVDVLFTNNNYELDSLARIQDPSVRLYHNDKYSIYKFLNKSRLLKYKLIIFTSRSLYYAIESTKNPTVFEYFPVLKDFQEKVFSLEHHLEYIGARESHSDTYGVLANPARDPRFDERVVNFARFGSVNITEKNKITTFIVVGNIEAGRKNHALLIDSLLELSQRKLPFKLIVVARRGILDIPETLRASVDFHTSAPYGDLYTLVEQADYILPMLDPDNPEHKRYLETGTSGTFQLSYGFCKPCIIHSAFAEPYGFSHSNSIIYEKNAELLDALSSAINLDTNSYRKMQRSIKYLADSITDKSAINFKNLIKNAHREC